MLSWYVVHTQPQKEDFAMDNLRNQGYEVYLPTIEKIRKHARKTEVVKYPLFPRYAFVALDITTQSWRSINGTRGVVGVLTQNGTPSPVASEILDELRRFENKEGCVSIHALNVFRVGDQVTLAAGPLKGQEATVVAISDKDRVQILLHFLGQSTVTSVKGAQLVRQ